MLIQTNKSLWTLDIVVPKFTNGKGQISYTQDQDYRVTNIVVELRGNKWAEREREREIPSIRVRTKETLKLWCISPLNIIIECQARIFFFSFSYSYMISIISILCFIITWVIFCCIPFAYSYLYLVCPVICRALMRLPTNHCVKKMVQVHAKILLVWFKNGWEKLRCHDISIMIVLLLWFLNLSWILFGGVGIWFGDILIAVTLMTTYQWRQWCSSKLIYILGLPNHERRKPQFMTKF